MFPVGFISWQCLLAGMSQAGILQAAMRTPCRKKLQFYLFMENTPVYSSFPLSHFQSCVSVALQVKKDSGFLPKLLPVSLGALTLDNSALHIDD